jgi:hypothetical protein
VVSPVTLPGAGPGTRPSTLPVREEHHAGRDHAATELELEAPVGALTVANGVDLLAAGVVERLGAWA